jgi:SH3-like domain-containing protein
MRQPLGPGVELRIIQRHGDWAEVRLMDGNEGWLPLAALEDI